jgi:hypothetical protein
MALGRRKLNQALQLGGALTVIGGAVWPAEFSGDVSVPMESEAKELGVSSGGSVMRIAIYHNIL